jgi:hypothetical protein
MEIKISGGSETAFSGVPGINKNFNITQNGSP